jgi:hypothetical protein
VDLYNGEILLRSTSITAATWTYTAAMHTTDGAPSAVVAKIYQINSAETSDAEQATITYI